MKILITGANGQLGKCLQDAAESMHGHELLFLGREHFAIDQFAMVTQVMQAIQPDWVINTAAYTVVDKAETQSDLAYLINAESVGHLAKVCKQTGAKLLHVSTDYVFDGKGNVPYKETDAVDPLGVYGQSKQLGEALALEQGGEVSIIRTSWVYSRHGSNFVKTMLRLMKEKTELKVVNDQTGCPTWAFDLAMAIFELISSNKAPFGIYHYCNSGAITWWQFAKAIAEIANIECVVLPITSNEFATLANRPAYSVLDTQKIQAYLHAPIPGWRNSLEHCLADKWW